MAEMSDCARVGPTQAASLPFIIHGKHLQSISGLINSLQRPLNYSSGYREQLELAAASSKQLTVEVSPARAADGPPWACSLSVPMGPLP